ncbi:MAG: hypothetical protein ACE5DM_01525 [Candidatus Nanoarchaeia archaeon]
MMTCKICAGQFDMSPDSRVLCENKDGVVHVGCCVDHCSQDGKPCRHALSKYEKTE